MADSLSTAGLEVSDVGGSEDAATVDFQPSAADTTRHGISVTPHDLSRFPVGATAELLQVPGHGEAAHLGTGVVVFSCHGHHFSVSGENDVVEMAAITELVTLAGCDARPPGVGQTITADDGTQLERAFSIREARLEQAITALGREPCCGEPSHGGSGAATGMVWEDTEVFIFAGPPMTDDPDYQAGQLTELAGGQADLGDGDGLPIIAFDCGDTNYQLSHDSTNADVQIRAAEALVGQLDCTPRVGPAD